MNRYLRYALLPLLAALALAFAGCGTNTPLVPPDEDGILSFGTDQSLEVVTWNLRTFPLDASSLQTIAQIVPQMQADVIAFQEIMDYSAFYELANLIPNYSAYVYNATTSYRLAYLYDTRAVQVNDAYTIFEGETNPFPRAPYVLDLDFQGRNVKVVNNHFKAFGNNHIDETDPWDEEVRRRLACQLLDQYIVENFPDDSVIVVGDLNDQIAEPPEYNVFQVFLDKPQEYRFADMHIALDPTYNTVSYPSYLSHIDHIMVSNELFGALDHPESECRVIRVDEYLGSWQNYSDQISDHRPLGLKLYLY
ncbi:MAG: endonuclease/exonuclease/phosphatase family protein [Candidatus Cloacimonetes bacterium]|nr:endonuclease/exonuclease/phosphatase family protein [Candidatus Cloacimonadota bacterium]